MTGTRSKPPVLVDSETAGFTHASCCCKVTASGSFMCLIAPTASCCLARSFLNSLNWATGIGEDGRPTLCEIFPLHPPANHACPWFPVVAPTGNFNFFQSHHGASITSRLLERCNLFSKRNIQWMAGSKLHGQYCKTGARRRVREISACSRSFSTGEVVSPISCNVQHLGDSIRRPALYGVGPGVLR